MSTALVQDDSDSDSSSDSDDEDVQLGDYLPGQSGKLGGGEYNRVIPSRFTADSDDIFMRSVYNNYAREVANKDGVPQGIFYLTKSDARALAQEVLATHKNIRGGAQDKYLATYWDKAWGHFDVNKTG